MRRPYRRWLRLMGKVVFWVWFGVATVIAAGVILGFTIAMVAS